MPKALTVQIAAVVVNRNNCIKLHIKHSIWRVAAVSLVPVVLVVVARVVAAAASAGDAAVAVGA